LGFDPWQEGIARYALAKDESGEYAADTVVLSIPRQVGKTYLVGALVFADSIINPGTTTVWTAHRFKVARETFKQLKAVAEMPSLLPHVDPDDIYTAAGNESITFRNGSRVLFAARERGAIRGFSKVRRLILDEAQILTEDALSDLAPTMNQAVNPQMILMGTPPKPTDPGESFTNLRRQALDGGAEGLLYVELSAEPGCDYDDEANWREANPSYPLRTPKKAILRLRKLLSDDDFGREALGIWGMQGGGRVIGEDVWAGLSGRSKPSDDVAFAVDVPPERDKAVVAVASNVAGGVHVELIDQRSGTDWVAGRVGELVKKWGPRAVMLDPAGPAGSLIVPLGNAGVEPQLVGGREMAQACGHLFDLVMSGQLIHLDDPVLNLAVDAGRRRRVGDAWAWHRRDTSADISPLVAVTLAVAGLGKPRPKVKSNRASFV
jgi:phage terminase large subunit-like protein